MYLRKNSKIGKPLAKITETEMNSQFSQIKKEVIFLAEIKIIREFEN